MGEEELGEETEEVGCDIFQGWQYQKPLLKFFKVLFKIRNNADTGKNTS